MTQKKLTNDTKKELETKLKARKQLEKELEGLANNNSIDKTTLSKWINLNKAKMDNLNDILRGQ